MTKRTIVIADDDANYRRLYTDLLESNGYNVLASNDGPGALSILSRVEPRLMLLDILMPGLNGIETCRRARQILHPRIPILFVTALDYAEHIKEGLKAGGDDYILKSASLDTVLARLRFWCSPNARMQTEPRRARALDNVDIYLEECELHGANRKKAIVQRQINVKLTDFLQYAMSAADDGFGKSREQQLYFLGYVAGAVNSELSLHDDINSELLGFVRGVIRASGVLPEGQIEEFVNSFEASMANDLVMAGWRRGVRDHAAAEAAGPGFVPRGLMEFKLTPERTAA